MASLKLNGVNKVYPSGETALYNINLETSDKEFIVVLGGDESGKSTLLRVVAGLEDVTSGEIFVGDKNVTEADPKDRDIAMVFKSSTLYPGLNVFDNMGFGLAVRKAPKALIEQRVKAAAKILGLTEVLYLKPKALTAAARQRVAIGRAIVREPKLYLFDEPLSDFDDKLRQDMLNVIINLQARMQGTFVYATKNLAEAMTIGTRIIVLKNGIVQQVDTPMNLYDYPANAYVAFYIGAPTVNFVKNAKICKYDTGYAAVCGDFTLPLHEKTVERFKNIEQYADTEKEVWLGIRPEDAEIKAGGAVKAKVCKSEADDDAVYTECELESGISMIVRGQTALNKDDSVEISIDLQRMFVFDAESRLTLLERDEGYVKTDYSDADVTPMTFEEEKAVTEKAKSKKDGKKKK